MPRIARIVFPGVPHHVTQRGNRREQVFFGDGDRRAYLRLLRLYAARNRIEILAYCLMTNHVHLVVVPATREGLYRTLHPLHMRHAQRINRLRGWQGHLWQARYFSSPLDDSYALTAIRYVERNPVRAGMIERAEQYRWSSAAAHCGLRDDPVLTPGASWRGKLEAITDWPGWLAAGDDHSNLEKLRKSSNKGLPCGSAEFLDQFERETGRVLGRKRPGRPRYSGHEKGNRP